MDLVGQLKLRIQSVCRENRNKHLQEYFLDNILQRDVTKETYTEDISKFLEHFPFLPGQRQVLEITSWSCEESIDSLKQMISY
jgi:hypothetical protein